MTTCFNHIFTLQLCNFLGIYCIFFELANLVMFVEAITGLIKRVKLISNSLKDVRFSVGYNSL